MQPPEIYLNAVGHAFDAAGNLTKDSLKTVMQQYIDAFAAHVAKHNG
jgi:chromate reductase